MRLFCVYYILTCLSMVSSVCLEALLLPRRVFVAQAATVTVGLSIGWGALHVWGTAGAVVGMTAGAVVGVALKIV